MKICARLLALFCLGLWSGCASNPESTSYEEWKQEQKARWQARQAGIEYKTKAEVRKEAEEMRAIATEVMNSAVKPAPAAPTADENKALPR
jgi:hypothetical protein